MADSKIKSSPSFECKNQILPVITLMGNHIIKEPWSHSISPCNLFYYIHLALWAWKTFQACCFAFLLFMLLQILLFWSSNIKEEKKIVVKYAFGPIWDQYRIVKLIEANSSCDSHFHNGSSHYHKMGWFQYIWNSHNCWISFRTTEEMLKMTGLGKFWFLHLI